MNQEGKPMAEISINVTDIFWPDINHSGAKVFEGTKLIARGYYPPRLKLKNIIKTFSVVMSNEFPDRSFANGVCFIEKRFNRQKDTKELWISSTYIPPRELLKIAIAAANQLFPAIPFAKSAYIKPNTAQQVEYDLFLDGKDSV